MKTISQPVKMYAVHFSVEGNKFGGMSHGINEDEAKETFQKRNPDALIIKVEEVKIKN